MGNWQAEAGGWMVTARLRGKEAMREVAVEGLGEATLVKELLRRAAVVQTGAEVALQCQSRLLQAEDTLAEAGRAVGGYRRRRQPSIRGAARVAGHGPHHARLVPPPRVLTDPAPAAVPAR